MVRVLAELAATRQGLAQHCLTVAAKYTPADLTISYRKRLTGCAWAKSRRICAPRPLTRRALHIYLHEVAHVVLEHYHDKPEYIQEYEAELWAFEVMEKEGIPVPAQCLRRAQAYVAYLIEKARCHDANVDNAVLEFAGL